MHQENINTLYDTLNICREGVYCSQGNQIPLRLSGEEMRRVRVFLPDEVNKLCAEEPVHLAAPGSHCRIDCRNTDTFTMAIERTDGYGAELENRVLILNFANPVHPGGGVRRGCRAQEEDLCLKSTLLTSLETSAAAPYYEYHRERNSFMASDAMIYTPNVEIIKDKNLALLPETVLVSVLTCAAPKISYGLEGMTEAQYEAMLYGRIQGILRCAAYLGHRRLILGAFGCGAFGNDARIVSDLFLKALQDFQWGSQDCFTFFETIDFAVMSRSSEGYNLKQFQRNFDKAYFAGDSTVPCIPVSKTVQGGNEFVFFWKDQETNGFLSNWYPSPFTVDCFIYNHMEQYLMAAKAKVCGDPIRYTAILKADTPEDCKHLGRKVAPYDEAAWCRARAALALEGLRAKFSQDPRLKQALLSTGNAILAEASPLDMVWGIGLAAEDAARIPMEIWPGQNILGKALMELRKELQG